MLVMFPVVLILKLLSTQSTDIDCSTSDCEEIDCPANNPCIVSCFSYAACTNSIINCPHNASCQVYCHGTQACDGAIVNASMSSNLRIDSTGFNSGPAYIYCSSRTELGNCQIYGHGTSIPVYNHSNIFGFKDNVRIWCECADLCFNDGTLFCERNICDITDSIYETDNDHSPSKYDYYSSACNTLPTTTLTPIAIELDSDWVLYVLLGSGIFIFAVCLIGFCIYHIKQAQDIKDYAESHTDTKPSKETSPIQTLYTPNNKQMLAPVPSNSYRPSANYQYNYNVELYKWLEAMELEEYYDTFTCNGYKNFNFIIQITDEIDLENIGITMKGHQRMLLNRINSLKDQNSSMNRLRSNPEGNNSVNTITMMDETKTNVTARDTITYKSAPAADVEGNADVLSVTSLIPQSRQISDTLPIITTMVRCAGSGATKSMESLYEDVIVTPPLKCINRNNNAAMSATTLSAAVSPAARQKAEISGTKGLEDLNDDASKAKSSTVEVLDEALLEVLRLQSDEKIVQSLHNDEEKEMDKDKDKDMETKIGGLEMETAETEKVILEDVASGGVHIE